MKAILYLIALLGVVIFGATFMNHNPETVTLTYYLGIKIDVYLTVALAVAMIAGILIGWLLSQLSVVRAKSEVRRARKEVRRNERELESLRSLVQHDEDALI